jgi:hypothetical protein
MKNIKNWYFSHACVYLRHGEWQWGSKTWSQQRRHISEVPWLWVAYYPSSASSTTSPPRAVGFLEIAALTSLMMDSGQKTCEI